MASAIRKFPPALESSEAGKRRKEEEIKGEKEKEVEKKDTCVYDEYKKIEEVTDDMFSDDETEECRRYCKYSIMTEGFYVPFAPEGLGVVTPIDTSNSFWPLIEEGARMAVKHYNKNRAGPDGQLRLLSLRNANLRSAGGMTFYITLKAENIVSGDINDYQTLVFMRVDMSLEVQSFRKDPEVAFKLIEREKAGLL